MLDPKFTMTHAIKSALEDVERQIWLVDHVFLMPRHEAWVRREVQVKRSVGTTQIEGATLDEFAVRGLIREGGVRNPTGDEMANLNAVQAYSFVDFLSDQVDIPVDELVFRQLNRFLLQGAPESLTPGVYRNGRDAVGNYTPPHQGDVPGLMRSLAQWVNNDAEDIHPVAKAGLTHIQLLAIHPFWDGNGRTARALATLIFQRSPFSFRKLLSFEGYLSQDRQEYLNAIERTLGTHYSDGYDATPWLEFFVTAWRQHVQEFTTGLINWHSKMEEVYSNAAEKGWLQRQADGLMLAFQAGKITRPDYIEITGVSPVTASRDLAAMVEAEMLVPVGNTRARVYYPFLGGPGNEGWPMGEQLPLLKE